jgi:peptide-methionine (R)-S-oxide reductase
MKINKTESEWKQELGPEQFQVCRLKATEYPFTGVYCDFHEPGVYHCSCCETRLFDSDSKFDSGCGWPSFYQPISKEAVREEADLSHGMRRVEVLCSNCDAHLGHVFEDGPPPTGLRYCINSVSLKHEPR